MTVHFIFMEKKLPYNQISYTRISPKNGSGSVNLLNTNNWFFNCGCCTLYFDKSGPQPNLQMIFFWWVGGLHWWRCKGTQRVNKLITSTTTIHKTTTTIRIKKNQ